MYDFHVILEFIYCIIATILRLSFIPCNRSIEHWQAINYECSELISFYIGCIG